MTEQAHMIDQANWRPYLERRLMRLLFVHNHGAFKHQFHTFRRADLVQLLPLFQQYDRFLRLITMNDELLDDIMPRIRRQLSLHTDHQRLREEAPTRGDIDWNRTIERSLRSFPDQPPLTFDTRLRQRSTVTPENMLVVMILLAVQKQLDQVRDESLLDEDFVEQEVQTLTVQTDALARELAAPYAQLLTPQVADRELEHLIKTVEQRLPPGINAYRDLLEWWQRFETVRFGPGLLGARDTIASTRTDDQAAAFLYEYWLAVELLHALASDPLTEIEPVSDSSAWLNWTFTRHGERWRFRYNRQIANQLWHHAPDTRPDYLVERAEPRQVVHDGTLYWQESGVAWDAKYYLGSHDSDRHPAMKKMLGDMVLLDITRGALVLPLLAEPATGHVTHTLQRTQQRYAAHNIDLELALYHISPALPLALIHSRLVHMLDSALEYIKHRPSIACRGVMLDVDSVNASPTRLPKRMLCPKPYIAPAVIDLVDQHIDCLKNPRMCHVIDQAIVPPYVKRVLNQDDLIQATKTLRTHVKDIDLDDESANTEHYRQQLIQNLGELTESYIKYTRADTKQAEQALKYMFEEYWDSSPDAISEHTRNMLIAGQYVYVHLSDVALDDWAITAVQFVRALEHEMTQRLFFASHNQLLNRKKSMQLYEFTFGKPGYIVKHYQDPKNQEAAANWQVFQRHIVHPAGITEQTFEALLLEIDALTTKRNAVAHKDPITLASAQTLYTKIIGTRRSPGLLVRFVELLKNPYVAQG